MPSTISKAFLIVLSSAIFGTSASPVSRADTTSNDAELIAKLKVEPTRFDRLHDVLTNGQNLLPEPQLANANVFDFNDQLPVPGGEGGTVATAYAENFPFILDSGLSFSIASLGPCGVFFPHVHPRANEIFAVIDGELTFGVMVEGAVLPSPVIEPAIPPILGTLKKYQATLFPQGSVHYQQNERCENATIVAALSNDDAGTTPILQQVGGAPAMNMSKRAADIGDIEMYYSILPPVIVEAAKKCVATCGK